MSKSPVELDFFGTKSPRSSIRGIQSAISKIDPQIFKNLISGGGAADASPLSPLPVLSSSRCGNGSATAPMTIFYNGAVTVLDLPRDKAEAIIKLAEEGSGGGGVGCGGEKKRPIQMPEEDLPIARRKSLQRFLQKRKERFVAPVPYGGGATSKLVVVGSEKEKTMLSKTSSD